MNTRTASPRVYTDADRMLPRALIRAVIALILSSLAIVIYATVTDRTPSSIPPGGPVAAEAEIVLLSDAMTGAVTVLGPEGQEITALTPEEGGFVAGVHRVILRERSRRGLAADTPVVIRAFENGRLAIHDPASGWGADLMAFGTDNANAFAKLLATTRKGTP